jgi:hypothetical protein
MKPLRQFPAMKDPEAINDPRDAKVIVVVGCPPMVVVSQKLQEPDRHSLQKIDTIAVFGQPNCCPNIEKRGTKVVV